MHEVLDTVFFLVVREMIFLKVMSLARLSGSKNITDFFYILISGMNLKLVLAKIMNNQD